MKLNYKRTIFVGFAFFLICAFWQAYDNTIPLILTNKFGLSQTASGVVMALDNILALFMLPLFGALSDKCRHRLGKRTPFILIGTIIAALALFSLSFVDNMQRKNLDAVSKVDDPAALHMLYEKEGDKTLEYPDTLGRPKNDRSFKLNEKFTEDEFVQISAQLYWDGETLYTTDASKQPLTEYPASLTEKLQADKADWGTVTRKLNEPVTNPQYANYVVPARDAYAAQVTSDNKLPLILFVVLLLIALVAMSTFRSPAVALMPDVTIKPLRSKANAIINLMGSFGGIIVLGLGMLFATSSVRNAMMSYIPFFGAIAGIMLLALVAFRLTVNEPKLAAKMQEESERFGIQEEEEEDNGGRRKLNRPEFRSLVFLLASIVLWFMGYNAVTSKYSVYATRILGKDYNLTMIIAQAAAILSYLPVGIISSKLGRKKTILSGVVILATSFLVAGFLRESSPGWLMNAMFVLAGIGWATINVNSFPMVVEMSRGSDVGKYTGIYYAASMAAQALTPIFSGFLMDQLGLTVLFPYATLFVALAFVTMIFVRHGDNKPIAKKGLEALDVED